MTLAKVLININGISEKIKEDTISNNVKYHQRKKYGFQL